MIDETERIWKETAVAWSRYYSRVYLEGLRKTTKNLSQNSQCSSRGSNQTCLEQVVVTIILLYIASSDWIDDELKRIWKDAVMS
jgi:hypothetical protein